jgi:bifunctional DNA-binding transcriptional regulator/antitoxin component of YhaV-PrlF toxin-antitoxin module
MDAMNSPSTRVKVDGQGRMVLPKWLRQEIVATPGEVMLRRTPDGVLLVPVPTGGEVLQAADGLPMLTLSRPVSNDHVIAAIAHERADR